MSALSERGGTPGQGRLVDSLLAEPVVPHPSDDDSPHRWEESSGEERDRLWHTDHGNWTDW